MVGMFILYVTCLQSRHAWIIDLVMRSHYSMSNKSDSSVSLRMGEYRAEHLSYNGVSLTTMHDVVESGR